MKIKSMTDLPEFVFYDREDGPCPICNHHMITTVFTLDRDELNVSWKCTSCDYRGSMKGTVDKYQYSSDNDNYIDIDYTDDLYVQNDLCGIINKDSNHFLDDTSYGVDRRCIAVNGKGDIGNMYDTYLRAIIYDFEFNDNYDEDNNRERN